VYNWASKLYSEYFVISRYSKVPLLKPLDINTSQLLRPPIYGQKQSILTYLYLGLTIRTDSQLRPVFVDPEGGLISETLLY